MIPLGEGGVQQFRIGDLIEAVNVVVAYNTDDEGNKWPYDLFINKGVLGIVINVSEYWLIVKTEDGTFKCQHVSHFRNLSREY